ncbi:FRG domain-containing protein [Hyphomonas sp.]|uniref:FRG domain-containing protein n=1 Tax=Hyphomonas sp. TaxID=87 RepID=UPI00391B879F
MFTHIYETAPSAKAFIEQLLDAQSSWQNSRRGIFVWRGVGDFDKYKLVPSALRVIRSPSLLQIANLQSQSIYSSLNDNLKQAYLEFKVIEGFLKLADRSGLPMPDLPQNFRNAFDDFADESGQSQFESLLLGWPHRNVIPFISLAQHYGLPTRLLDWTYSSLTAAYFAGESALRHVPGDASGEVDQKYLAVWLTNPYDLSGTAQRNQNTNALDLRVEVSAPPRFQNPNLNAQSGLFTWLSGPLGLNVEVARMPLDDLVNKMKQKIDPNSDRTIGSFMVFRLAWRHADELVSRLFNLGVSRASLEPGFGGVASAMKVLANLRWEPGR